MKIIIADDELVIRKKLEANIKNFGFEVLTAVDGLEAWEMWQQEKPPIVITDWLMPKMDGLELCSRIRESEENDYTYIVMVTSKDSYDDMIQGMEAGVDDYISKPFRKNELLLRLAAGERIVGLHREIHELNKELEYKVVDRTVQLEGAKKTIIEKEHKSGMAEIASGTLHNIRNILHSVHASVYSVGAILDDSSFSGLKKANNMLRENVHNLEDFICKDPKGKKLLQYYFMIENEFVKEHEEIRRHLARLDEKTKSIEDVISPQQKYAGTGSDLEKLCLTDIVDDALKMDEGLMKDAGIKVIKKFIESPKICAFKTKLLHIIVNLIKNARESMLEVADEGELIISIDRDSEAAYVKVSDTGEGISREDQGKMFSYGFTTKKEGHGFGLHSCANYMKEMNGDISAESEGKGKGATFTLKFNFDDNAQAS